MSSRPQSPQSLFLGNVVYTSVSPHADALGGFVAFADQSPTDGNSGLHCETISPMLRGLSLSPGRTPEGHPLELDVNPHDDDSSDEGPALTPRGSLDETYPALNRTQPFIATLPPTVCAHRRSTAVFINTKQQEIVDVAPQPPLYRLREATADGDAEGILALTNRIDMTNATSYIWPLDELRDRILRRDPLTIVAVDTTSGVVAGCAGIDTHGMTKPLRVLSIGSRVSGCGANHEYDTPDDYCMCRGLLIHPEHQSAGLGSRLHRYRIETLSQLYPCVRAVVLSARGSSFEEAATTLGPMMMQPRESDVTPEFSKETLFQFTFRTSQGVVHLAHHREKDGWRFVGVDVTDGGPVWCTSIALSELVSRYPQSRRNTAVLLEPLLAHQQG